MNDFDAPTIITTPPTRTVSAVMTEPPLGADNYQIGHEIARGGMGAVYRGIQRSLERPVAIKILFPEFATDPNFVERFRREAQAAANLNHPNIVGVYDWGQEGGTYFIVMEYIEGRSLAETFSAPGSAAWISRRVSRVGSTSGRRTVSVFTEEMMTVAKPVPSTRPVGTAKAARMTSSMTMMAPTSRWVMPTTRSVASSRARSARRATG